MTNIDKSDKFFAFVKPNNANIHVHAKFEKIVRTLNSFNAQRRMIRIGYEKR